MDNIELKDIDVNDLELIDKELDVDELKDISGGSHDYLRCKICGRPHNVIKRYGICQRCLSELLKNKPNTD